MGCVSVTSYEPCPLAGICLLKPLWALIRDTVAVLMDKTTLNHLFETISNKLKKGSFPSLFKLKIPTIPLWIMCIFRRKDGLEMQGKLVSTESKNTVLDYELLKIFQCLYITKMKEERNKMKKILYGLIPFILLMGIMTGCSSKSNTVSSQISSNSSPSKGKTVTLTIGAYSTPQEALDKIIPLFQKEYKQKTGETIKFKESYQGSGSQTTSILNGYEADIAILSVKGDMDKLVAAGLLTNKWTNGQYGGMITDSVDALGVRKGNPKNIQDWTDLTKSGVGVVIPNPKTSGGAQWDVNAIYGAGLKLSQEKTGKEDPAYAKRLLAGVYKNVKSLDASGRDATTTFNKGVGDVLVTYENELIESNKSGGTDYEIIIPKDTIKIENPAAVVDKYAKKHSVEKEATAFLNYLWSNEAQKVFAEEGFRPVNNDIAKQYANQFKTPSGLFDISYLGGWYKVESTLYNSGGIWDQVVANSN